MAETERNARPSVGAGFWRDGKDVMFQFVIDPGNVIGPRAATRSDSEKHPEAWATFIASEQRSPLDRDAKDGPGGSLPTDPRVADEDPPAPPETVVEEKDMSGFVERLEPAKPVKRPTKRRG